MSRPVRPLPWAPRPFDGEALGSWIGRVAGRYRMSVVQLNADLDLQIQLDGPLTWLLPAAGPRSVARIAQLTRLSEANVPVCSVVDTVTPQRKTFYCRRCVFLNPVEVESPYWHAAWLSPDASVCEVHRLPLARINASSCARQSTCRTCSDE